MKSLIQLHEDLGSAIRLLKTLEFVQWKFAELEDLHASGSLSENGEGQLSILRNILNKIDKN